MAQNKSRGLAGAQSMVDFPLTTFSLHPVLHKYILPAVYPLLMTSAIMMIGCAGVGKTPALVTMALAMGRFHIRRLAFQGVKPGWRRAKSLDNFRHRVPQVQEAVFLDDPSRSKISIADLKSFVTVDEDGTCDGRYNDARLARNQMRAVASNDLGADPYLASDDARVMTLPLDATTLPPEAFFELVKPFFKGDHMRDILAVLKRAIFSVFTESALYVRLPSAEQEAVIHRVVVDNVHKDLLAEKDKPLYGQYKCGMTVYGQDHEAEVRKEQVMIVESMEKLSSFARAQDYINHANHELQMG